VNQVVPQLVSAALVGAFSPIATMATIAVLTGQRRPLANALCLLVGWTFVLMALAGLMLALLGDAGSALSDQTKAVLNVIIGILLLSFGLRNVIGARHPMAHIVEDRPEHRQKPPGWMAALDVLTPLKAFGVGAVLLLVSPADLAVYLSALQGLSGNQFSALGRLLTLLGLVAAIDLCILVPLAIYVAMPRRAAHLLGAMRQWLTTHQRRATAWVLLVFGVLLSVSGVIQLA
jgi:hypothetical protein